MSPFKIGIIIFCGAIALVAMLIFSGTLPGFRGSDIGAAGEVVMWGAIDSSYFSLELNELNIANKDRFFLSYVQKDPATLDQELTLALAEGRGPDLVILPHDLLVGNAKKIEPISYDTVSVKDFKQAFIPEGDLFLTTNGILALPWYVDPLVMYYNDDILTRAGIPVPPKYWTEIQSPLSTGLLKKVTQLDTRNSVLQSAIALGHFGNINHVKDIISLLTMQAGNKITIGEPDALNVDFDKGAQTALNFFVQFSDPAKEQYTWNSALPPARDLFAGGKLGLYLGKASDLEIIQKANPHLAFNAVMVPQVDNFSTQTFGTLYGVSVLKAGKRKAPAIAAATVLTGKNFAGIVAEKSPLPPARRDLLGKVGDNNFKNVFYQSALVSRAWLDPNPAETERIFREMVDNVLVGRLQTTDAVSRARDQIGRIK